MADGSVKIGVGLSIDKAERDLAKLKDKIMKAEDALNANSARKSELETRLEELGNTAEAARRKIQQLKEEYANSQGNEKASIKAHLDRNMANYNATVKDIDALSREYQKVDQNIEKGTKDLEKMKEQAGEMAQQLAAARPGEALANGLDLAKKKLMTFLKYAIGIRSVYILFNKLRSSIKDAVKQYAEYDKELKTNLATMDATKKAISATMGGGFANIYTALLPVIQKIANWMLEAANAASRFVAIVSGKTSYKRAVVSNEEIAASLDNVADSAKEAKRQVMGFDELNILSGGASGTGGASQSALDGIEMVEEAIDAMDGSFLSNFALSVKDVLFSWKDLNPEQIAEKFVAGLGSVLGAALGIALGLGPGGVILMTLAGLTIGLIASSLIFDHDGKLSRTEILNMLGLALAGLVGGLIGFQIGGIKGALLGAVIGVSLTLLVTALSINQARQNFNDTEFGKQVSALKAEIRETLQADADLRIRINSITGEIDENTLADLGAAQSLLDQIFTLDGKENKTAEELELLKQQVEAFNSLGLGDIQIQFDDTTGHIVSTREEVQGLLDDLMRQYQLEAMKEAYVESFKAQYESTENVKKATGEATQAASDYETALQNLKTAQEELTEAAADYSKHFGLGGTRERYAEATEAYKAANEAVKAAKENAETAKEALTSALDTADLAAEKVTGIGDALADLVTKGADSGKNTAKGYSEGITKNAGESAKEAKKMGEGALDALNKSLGINSPSKEAYKAGEYTVDGYIDAVEDGSPKIARAMEDSVGQMRQAATNGINSMRTSINQMFTGIVQDVARNLQSMRNLMNFQWAIPRPKVPRIEWEYSTMRYGDNQRLSIPQFLIRWYARGGIFDRASLIGVGEAGKEAVVPLERNTEWMRVVADGLMQRLEQSRFAEQLASAIATTPMPAMASGSVVPPNAIQYNYGYENIADAVRRGMVDAMSTMNTGSSGGGSWAININGREFMRATYSDFKAVENEYGVSLIET